MEFELAYAYVVVRHVSNYDTGIPTSQFYSSTLSRYWKAELRVFLLLGYLPLPQQESQSTVLIMHFAQSAGAVELTDCISEDV